MLRRDFLRYGGAGLLAAGATHLGGSTSASAACELDQPSCLISLAIGDRSIEMIDGRKFRFLGFRRLATSAGEQSDSGPRVPGPVLRVVEGQTVTIRVRNNRPLAESHSFHITGANGTTGGDVSINAIPGNGGVGTVTFRAPVAGTYIYHDPSHPSLHLYRMLGLHGVMVVHPRTGRSLSGLSTTPYSMDALAAVDPAAAQTISSVFDAFGRHARFPGGPWVPAPINVEYSAQERIWLFSEVDPDFNSLIHSDGIYRGASDRVIKHTVPLPATPRDMINTWVPRYFTINGKSGFDLSEDESVVVKNYVGEPTLLRTLNVGLCHHATHIHGNHLLQLAHSYVFPADPDALLPIEGSQRTSHPGWPIVHDNVWERDTWPTYPMQARDVLLPYEAPVDIPDWQRFEREPREHEEPFPMRFVMHDHCEMGTTAAGGNYPQGAVTHWEILGPVRRRPV